VVEKAMVKEGKVRDYAILASGQGTNALSLIVTGIRCGYPPRFVVVNKEDSPLMVKAKEHGIATYFIGASKKGVDKDFENRVLNICAQYNIDWIFLAGFLKVLSPQFLNEFNHVGFNQVVNIHPSLLPKYPGLGGYKKAFENKDKEFGHTLHLVTEGVDEGPILFQKVLSCPKEGTLDEMINIGKEQENLSYGRLLESLIMNGFQWDGKELLVSWVYP
jgi:phosphoribosylglycinamide formyltransferase-1